MGLRRVAFAGALVLAVLGCGAAAPETPTPVATVVATAPALSATPEPILAATTAPALSPTSIAPTATPPPPAATATATPDAAAEELARALANPPPKRDVTDLARRYRLQPGTPTSVGIQTPTPAPLGATADFWVAEGANHRYYRTRAQLLARGKHVEFWVQEGQNVDRAAAQRSIEAFESRIAPTIVRDFAADRVALDELKLTVLNARLPGLVGYFSSVDQHPAWVMPFSNERPLIAMNPQAAQPGSRGYESGLAHEFGHFVQARLDPGEETWVNEGTAELAVRAVGLDPGGYIVTFLRQPNVQLNNWSEATSGTAPQYGAADLFFTYLSERYGSNGVVGAILARPERGIAGIDAVLGARAGPGQPATFDAAFRDWTIANWANGADVADPRYSYQALRGARVEDEPLAAPTRVAASLNQYGARYYALPKDAAGATLSVEGPGRASLVGAPARGRPFWWSNRTDSANSRLTRRVDLTGLTAATLRFSAWYDMERDYDYAYVAVSTDDGRTWRTLPGRHTTESDPNGANYGRGYTGKSGGGSSGQWVEDSVDLTAYAGRAVMLRFEMVTDDAYNGDGFCIDEVRIEEAGWRDDGSGWQAEGFVRIQNAVPQRLLLRVAGRFGRDVRVYEAPTIDGKATLRLSEELASADGAVAIVTSHTPLTARPIDLTILLERTP